MCPPNDSTLIVWYSSATATSPLSVANPYRIIPTGTTTYYGANRFIRHAPHTGKPVYTTGGSSVLNNFGLRLDALNDLILDSLALYPVGTGSVTASLMSCSACATPVTLGIYTWSFTGATGAKTMVPVSTFYSARRRLPVAAGQRIRIK